MQLFTKKQQNVAFGWTAGYLPPNPSTSGIFLKFPKSKVVRQLVRQLVHSLSSDNNLVPFQLLWREIVLKSEKVSKSQVLDGHYTPISVSGQFPGGHFSDGLFPDGHFPEDISPTDTSSKVSSPSGQFPERPFPQRTTPGSSTSRSFFFWNKAQLHYDN